MAAWRIMHIAPERESLELTDEVERALGQEPPPVPEEIAHLPRINASLIDGVFDTRDEALDRIVELKSIPGNEKATYRIVQDVGRHTN